MKTVRRALIILGLLLQWLLIFYILSSTEKCFGSEREGWVREVTGEYAMGIEKGYTGGKITGSIGRYVNDYLSVRAEGHIGSLMAAAKEEDTRGIMTGLSFILRYDPIIYIRGGHYPKYYRLYFDAGVGVGYASNIKQPSLLKPGMTGTVDAGMGVIFPLSGTKVEFVIGYKFMHISSLKPQDKGLNMNGVMVGIRF